jgi:hypothetical protein
MPEVSMLIDSGADVSMIPQAAITVLAIDVSAAPQFEIVGVEGRSTLARAVSLELSFLGRRFRGQFLVTANEYGILGRNVLNSIRLLLDGPNLVWSELGR